MLDNIGCAGRVCVGIGKRLLLQRILNQYTYDCGFETKVWNCDIGRKNVASCYVAQYNDAACLPLFLISLVLSLAVPLILNVCVLFDALMIYG